MSFVLLLKQLELSMFLSVCFAKPSSFPHCLFHLFDGKFLLWLLCCFHFTYSGFCLLSWDFPCFNVVFRKYKEINPRILRASSAWMVSSRGMTASLYIVESEYEISPCFPVWKLVFSGPFVHQSNAPWLRNDSTFPLPWIQDNRKSMPTSNQSGLFTLWPVNFFLFFFKSVGKKKKASLLSLWVTHLAYIFRHYIYIHFSLPNLTEWQNWPFFPFLVLVVHC